MYPNLYHREPSVKEYKYPVIDSEDQDKDNPCIIYIPIPKNTQRLYVDPTGKYIICKWNIEKTIKGIDPVLQKLYIKSITGELTGTRCKIHSCNR